MKPRLHLFGHHHEFTDSVRQGVRSIGLDVVTKSYLLIDAETLPLRAARYADASRHPSDMDFADLPMYSSDRHSMALFEPPSSQSREEFIGSDAAYPRLVGHRRRKRLRRAGLREHRVGLRLHFFGPTLHPGRVQAIQRMGIGPGDRVLEVGVGTGINAALYPRDCSVTGIDLSGSMLEKARERIARKGISNVRLLEMDAADLKFADDTLRHRLRAVRDQRCSRSGGGRARDAPCLPPRRPHRHPEPLPQREPARWRPSSGPSRRSPCTSASSRISICRRFSRRPTCDPVSIEKVNVPRIWSLITCVKP